MARFDGVDWGGQGSVRQPMSTAPTGGNNNWLTTTQDPMQDYAAFGILNEILGLGKNQRQQAYDLQGVNMGSRKQAIENASPIGRQKAVDKNRAQLSSNASRVGKEAAMRAKAAGYGDQGGGIMADVMNAANQQGNQFQSDINSPESTNAALMQAMGLSDPNAVMNLTPTMLALLDSMYQKSGLVDAERARSRSSGLGGIAGGLLGNLTSGLDWTKVLGL